MKPLARAACEMPQSGIRQITNLAVTVPDCVRLEVGEPNFPTPPHIVEAAAKAARDGFTRYTATQGLLSLREAMSAKLARVNGLSVPPDRIVATNGALSGLYTTFLALLDPGDEVLIPNPGWPNWEMMILATGGVPVRYPTPKENGFLPRPDDWDPLITERTKAILINSPSNPTGAVMQEPLLRELVGFAQRHDLWMISDECYDECLFEGEHLSPARFDEDGRVISLFSCSKTYAMTGWRVGYAAVPQQAIEVLSKMQQPVLGNICSVAQKAAEAAFLGPQECVGEMRSFYRARRDQAMIMLDRAGFYVRKPAGAFYIMVDVDVADTMQFARDLLLNEKVAVAPGETFGSEGRGLVRVALCVSEQALEEGLARLIQVVKGRG